MAKTKRRARKQRRSQQGTIAPSHVNGQTPDTLNCELKKKKRGKTKKKMKMAAEQDKLETQPGKVPAKTRSWKGKMEELVKLLAGHNLDGVDNERKGIKSGREFMRSLRELQVWEVEKIKPGQIMVACPVCKLERLDECNQEFRNLRNHFKREHKRLKFYLVKSRCLKCPICHEIVSASQLGVHFEQGKRCEKDLLVDQSKDDEREDVKMEVPGGSGEANSEWSKTMTL